TYMADRRSPKSLPALPNAQTGLRHVLFRTLAGRLIVVGLAVRLALLAAAAVMPLPAFFAVVDTVAGIAIAIGVGYFLVRLFVRRQRSVAQQYAAASLAIVPVQRGCEARDSTPPADARRVSSDAGVSTAGPWAHVQPPPTVPAWVQCAGFGGVFAYSHATSS